MRRTSAIVRRLGVNGLAVFATRSRIRARASGSLRTTLGISDHGQPGAGNATEDVNLISGTGITIPGSFFVGGNFIVAR